MNQIIIITVISFFFSYIANSQIAHNSPVVANHSIRWTDAPDWQSVKNKALKENKYIFIDVVATWCGPCLKMERDVYSIDSIADFVNRHFIALKLQMDSTPIDDLFTRNWYADAQRINVEYAIQGFPSFLFFTPDGKLVFKDLGYKDVSNFSCLIKEALDTTNILLSEEYENYGKQIRNYPGMQELALFAKNVRADKVQAKVIAKDYVENYLNTLDDNKLISKKNLLFFNEFNTLITPQTRLFSICYAEPGWVDSVIQAEGWAEFQVEQAITREELIAKLITDDKPVFPNPAWDRMVKEISRKYQKVNASKLVLDFQILYYRYYDLNWMRWAFYKEKKVNKYPPQPIGLNVYSHLNSDGTWDAFLHCNQRKVLKRSIKWIDLAIKLDTVYKAAYLDTKANLLYKLGWITKALSLQKEAAILDSNNKEVQQALENMKKGQPTYLESGAEWDESALQRIQKSKKR